MAPFLRRCRSRAPDEQFATNRGRVTGYTELRPLVAAALRPQPRRYWIEKLTAAGVPCGSVRDLREVFSDPQLAAREMIVPDAARRRRTTSACSARRSSCRTRRRPMRAAPPTLGQHTDSVLAHDLGLGGEVIGQLAGHGVI